MFESPSNMDNKQFNVEMTFLKGIPSMTITIDGNISQDEIIQALIQQYPKIISKIFSAPYVISAAGKLIEDLKVLGLKDSLNDLQKSTQTMSESYLALENKVLDETCIEKENERKKQVAVLKGLLSLPIDVTKVSDVTTAISETQIILNAFDKIAMNTQHFQGLIKTIELLKEEYNLLLKKVKFWSDFVKSLSPNTFKYQILVESPLTQQASTSSLWQGLTDWAFGSKDIPILLSEFQAKFDHLLIEEIILECFEIERMLSHLNIPILQNISEVCADTLKAQQSLLTVPPSLLERSAFQPAIDIEKNIIESFNKKYEERVNLDPKTQDIFKLQGECQVLLDEVSKRYTDHFKDKIWIKINDNISLAKKQIIDNIDTDQDIKAEKITKEDVERSLEKNFPYELILCIRKHILAMDEAENQINSDKPTYVDVYDKLILQNTAHFSDEELSCCEAIFEKVNEFFDSNMMTKDLINALMSQVKNIVILENLEYSEQYRAKLNEVLCQMNRSILTGLKTSEIDRAYFIKDYLHISKSTIESRIETINHLINSLNIENFLLKPLMNNAEQSVEIDDVKKSLMTEITLKKPRSVSALVWAESSQQLNELNQLEIKINEISCLPILCRFMIPSNTFLGYTKILNTHREKLTAEKQQLTQSLNQIAFIHASYQNHVLVVKKSLLTTQCFFNKEQLLAIAKNKTMYAALTITELVAIQENVQNLHQFDYSYLCKQKALVDQNIEKMSYADYLEVETDLSALAKSVLVINTSFDEAVNYLSICHDKYNKKFEELSKQLDETQIDIMKAEINENLSDTEKQVIELQYNKIVYYNDTLIKEKESFDQLSAQEKESALKRLELNIGFKKGAINSYKDALKAYNENLVSLSQNIQKENKQENNDEKVENQPAEMQQQTGDTSIQASEKLDAEQDVLEQQALLLPSLCLQQKTEVDLNLEIPTKPVVSEVSASSIPVAHDELKTSSFDRFVAALLVSGHIVGPALVSVSAVALFAPPVAAGVIIGHLALLGITGAVSLGIYLYGKVSDENQPKAGAQINRLKQPSKVADDLVSSDQMHIQHHPDARKSTVANTSNPAKKSSSVLLGSLAVCAVGSSVAVGLGLVAVGGFLVAGPLLAVAAVVAVTTAAIAISLTTMIGIGFHACCSSRKSKEPVKKHEDSSFPTSAKLSVA
jgi:hypothetical protein